MQLSMQAAAELTRKGLAKIVLLGVEQEISSLAHQLNADISQVLCAALLVSLRPHKLAVAFPARQLSFPMQPTTTCCLPACEQQQQQVDACPTHTHTHTHPPYPAALPAERQR